MKTLTILTGVALLGLAACTNPDGTRDNRATGALVGAIGGAIVGNAIGGNSRGTLIGAGVGAATGAVTPPAGTGRRSPSPGRTSP